MKELIPKTPIEWMRFMHNMNEPKTSEVRKKLNRKTRSLVFQLPVGQASLVLATHYIKQTTGEHPNIKTISEFLGWETSRDALAYLQNKGWLLKIKNGRNNDVWTINKTREQSVKEMISRINKMLEKLRERVN